MGKKHRGLIRQSRIYFLHSKKTPVDRLFSKLKPCYVAYILHVLHRKFPQEAVDMMAEEMTGNFSNQVSRNCTPKPGLNWKKYVIRDVLRVIQNSVSTNHIKYRKRVSLLRLIYSKNQP